MAINYSSGVSSIQQDNSVVCGFNALPLGVNVSADGYRCYIDIELSGNPIISGLKMLQIDDRNFVVDLQPIVSAYLEQQNISTGLMRSVTMPKFKATVQAELNGVIETKVIYFYAIPESRQFGENPFITTIDDVNAKTKLNPSGEYWASVGKYVDLYAYDIDGSYNLTKNRRHYKYNAKGDTTQTYNGVSNLIHVESVCTDDIILSFLNHRSEYRQANFGRYYTETIEQGEKTQVLRPFVNLYSVTAGVSDKQTLHVDGTRKITITKRGVSRDEMSQLRYIITSPAVFVSHGASDDFVRVTVDMQTDVFDTKKPFTDVTITINYPQYYSI